MLNNLPRGTVTFLFTDIEGSTQLWERHPEAMKESLARHDDCLRRATLSHHGQIVKTTGDGAYAAFARAADAIAAALQFQRDLLADEWPELAPDRLAARVAAHTGEAELRDGDYHGTALNRAARIMALGHGGQVLLSAATAGLARETLPPDITFHDVGQHRLRGLSGMEQVFQLAAPGLPQQFPPLRGASTRVVALPQPPTDFIGRWQEVDEVVALLDAPGARLVSLIGPGGMGKTRLAIQVATTLAEREPERFPDGLCFVPLAPLTSAAGIAGAIASRIGFQFMTDGREPQQQLIDFLRGRKMLLVLDNLEHLLADGGADLPAAISEAAGDVTLLLTSRTRLGVQGEQLYPVPGLRVPDIAAVRQWSDPAAEAEQYSALRLFLQAARRASPSFRLTRENVAAVTRICQRVQGTPLGIILAANWLELLSPAEIAAEIDRSLDVLATDLRDVPERQRSLRAVFDTTWQLASEQERAILPSLAYFCAPFTRESAEAVAGAALRDLLALSNKSWLQRTGSADGQSHFVMHELLRQYTQQRIPPGETAAMEERYARYYIDLVDRSAPALFGAGQKEARATLAAEFDHIRHAWKWLIARGEFDTLVDRLLLPLHRLAQMRGQYRDTGHLVEQSIAACRQAAGENPARVLVPLLVVSQHLNYGDADLSANREEAWQLAAQMADPERDLGIWYVDLLGQRMYSEPRVLEQLLGLSEALKDGEAATLAAALAAKGLSIDAGERLALERSAELYRRAGRMVEQRGDHWAFAQMSQELAAVEALRGHHGDALALLDRAQAIYEALDDWQHVVGLAFARASFALGRGRPDLALEAWEAAVAICQERGDRLLESLMLGQHSIDAARYGDIDHARLLRERSLMMTRELGHATNEPWNLWELGEIHRVAGRLDEARRCYEAARALFGAQGNRMGLAYYRRGLGDLALATRDFAAAAEQFTEAAGALADFPHEPWSLTYMACGLARAQLGLGRPADALERIQASLSNWRRYQLPSLRPLLLEVVVELALSRARAETAAALCGLLAADPLCWNEIRGRTEANFSQAITALGAEQANALQAHGRALDPAALLAGLAAIEAAEPDEWLKELATVMTDGTDFHR